MMRKYEWIVVWATLVSASWGHAQYAPQGQPIVPLGSMPQSGDMIQRLTYINTMQMMTGGNVPDNAPGWEALTMPPTAAPGVMTSAPAPMAPEYVYESAASGCPGACVPVGACNPDPQAPIAPPPCRTHLPPNPNPKPPVDFCDHLANICAQCDGTLMPNLIYNSWVLNWLWRLNFDSLQDPGYHLWADFEYLRWRINNAPIAVPLVTTNPNPGTIGALNEPGTVVLFGAGSNQSTDLGLFSGGRISLGAFCNDSCPIAWETSGLLMETRTQQFSASSAGGTAPVVSIPFFATQPFNAINPGGETSLNGGGAANRIDVALSSRMWGLEGNMLVDLIPADIVSPLGLLAIVGFRYFDLNENLGITDTFFDPTRNGTIVAGDSFGAHNQFYGPQLGLHANLLVGRWTIDATAKIALGDDHQTQNIQGSTTVNNGAFGFLSGATPGGVFAEPSNIGHRSRDIFAILPEGEVKVYYELTQSIRPFLAYNVLYLNDAIRPGNQLNRNINPTENAFFVPSGPVTAGPAPTPSFNSSAFWAYGFNVGVELRF